MLILVGALAKAEGNTQFAAKYWPELSKWAEYLKEKGLTLIPTRLYWKNGRAKVEIALARGKNVQDKRRYLKEKDARREIQQALQDR